MDYAEAHPSSAKNRHGQSGLAGRHAKDNLRDCEKCAIAIGAIPAGNLFGEAGHHSAFDRVNVGAISSFVKNRSNCSRWMQVQIAPYSHAGNL